VLVQRSSARQGVVLPTMRVTGTVARLVGRASCRHGIVSGGTGGILIIAVADSMSDALGIHLAEESDPHSDTKQIWLATLVTFVTKFIVSLSFAVPLLIFPLELGVMISVLWGMLILIVLSWQLARAQETAVLPVVGEHLLIAVGVVVLSYFVGSWVSHTF